MEPIRVTVKNVRVYPYCWRDDDGDLKLRVMRDIVVDDGVLGSFVIVQSLDRNGCWVVVGENSRATSTDTHELEEPRTQMWAKLKAGAL